MSSKPLFHRASRWLAPAAASLILAYFLSFTPPGLLGKADALGYAVCHRIDERSFHIDGRQTPLCARCSGTFSLALIGLAAQAIFRPRRTQWPAWPIALALGLFALAFAVDGANSYLYLIKQTRPDALQNIPNLYVPQNWLRLLTGSGMGLGMSVLLYPVVNQTLWREQDERPALTGWRDLLFLLGLAALVDLAILSERTFLLYPLALISALGVPALLGLIFGLVWVIAMRQENTCTSARQLWLPLLAGLTIALIFITGIDLGRLWMTGNWGGLNFVLN
jgi:uncharacterized membrane protein